MKILAKGRRMGKSYEAVQHSAITQIPILCPNSRSVKHLLEIARQFNLTIPTPVTAVEYQNGKVNSVSIIIDDAFGVLKQMVFPAKIELMTTNKIEEEES